MNTLPVDDALQPVTCFRQARRLAAVGVSEILALGAAAAQLKREGHPVIVLAAGEPDFDTPENVKAAAERAIRAGRTKYTALDGTAELKEAVQHKFRRDNGLLFEAREITVAAGAKQVIHNAFMATLDPGDEVILAAPYWTSYADIVALAEGRPVAVPCRKENGFRMDPADLEAAITDRTRWLLLNSPSNPSGAAYSADQLAPILEVVRRYPQVWIMSDDIYEHLLYDGRSFATAAQVAPDLRARTLTVNGVSKAYAMTGWRIGFAGGPAPLIAAMAAVQSQSTSNAASVSQAAAVEALTGPQSVLEERRNAFQRRRDLVVDRLNSIPGLRCGRPEGAFYTYASCKGILGRRTPRGAAVDGDRAFCRYLLHEYHLAVVPGGCFGLTPFFRISYAASEADLLEACDRISLACRTLS